MDRSSLHHKNISGGFAISRIRFLLAGGFPLMRFGLRCMLADLGYQDIVEASDLITARSWVQSTETDFIITISDQQTHNDIALIRSLRESRRIQPIPILALREAGDDIQEIMEAGADGCLVTPYDTRTVLKEIQRIAFRYRHTTLTGC